MRPNDPDATNSAPSDLLPGRMVRFALWLHDRLMGLADRLSRYTVVLPLHAPVEWPEQCMGCGDCLPDRTWTMRPTRPSYWSIVVGLEPSWRRHRIDVPVCAACHRRARAQAWRGRLYPVLVLLSVLLSGLAAAAWLMPVMPLAARCIQIGAVVGSIIIAIGVGLAIGTPFDITAKERGILHVRFKSRGLALALARANGTKVLEPEPIE